MNGFWKTIKCVVLDDQGFDGGFVNKIKVRFCYPLFPTIRNNIAAQTMAEIKVEVKFVLRIGPAYA